MLIKTEKPARQSISISVVIPTYHRPDEIIECLRALEKQTRLPEQVIVTIRPEDTASVSGLTNFKEQSTLPLELVFIEEPGVVKALNAGLKSVKGGIVCFTDDDARPHPDWLERIAIYYADPRIGGVGGRDMVYNGGELEDGLVNKVGKLNWFGRRYGNHHLELKGGTPVEVTTLKGVNSSYRKELVDQFDLHLLGVTQVAYEDDMGLSIVNKGYRLIYDPRILVDHFPSHRRPEGRGERTTFDKTQIYNVNHNYTYVLLKHLPFWQKIFFLLYSFLIGDVPSLGLLRIIVLVISSKNWAYLKLLPTAFAGKIRGIETYLHNKNPLNK